MKKENKNKGMYSSHLLRTFLHYFRPHMGLFTLDILCALTVAAIDLAYPLISRKCLYEYIPQGEAGVRPFLISIGIVFAAYCIRSVMQYIIGYWGHTFGIRVEADIRSDLYRHIQSLSFNFFDRNRTGQLLSRMTSDLFDITELAHHGPEDIIICGITLIGSLIIMFSIQWRLAIVVALLIPIFAVSVILQRSAMMNTSRVVKEHVAEINTGIEAGLSGIRTARAFTGEAREIEKFEVANDDYRTAKREFHKAMGRFNATMEFFLCMLSAAVIGVGGWLIMEGKIDYVDLITFSLYISTFTNPMRKLANFSELFSSGFAGLHRFAELMDEEPAIRDAPNAEILEKAEGKITFEDVSFSYGNDTDVLKHVSVEIEPGEIVAVVGPSGGGKTTICQLIPRFYEVDEGSISVDGKDIRSLTQESLRRNIGIVQQDVFLFAASVKENIRYGRPDATDEEVYEAARKAEIYDDVMAMPYGFDTYVGERGALLSGGQKQRISIARIILKNPPILILDEATSALDTVTESKIQRALDALAKDRTTLIIAHRLSTIRAAKRILVIINGEIAETGTHAELMRLNGHYAELYKTQTDLMLN